MKKFKKYRDEFESDEDYSENKKRKVEQRNNKKFARENKRNQE